MNALSLEEAYRTWSDDLVGYATALVGADWAADVVADAFASLLSDDERWRSAREPRGYLFRCVLNSARMHERAGGRRRHREQRAVRGDGRVVSADRLLDDPIVAAAVRSLSVQQRALVFHAYWEDLSVADAARAVGVGEGSAKRQLARARARIRKALE